MFIKMVLAVYKEAPLIVNERAIAIGINNIIVVSWSIKIFFTAGSNSHAIAPVEPATTRDKKSATINCHRMGVDKLLLEFSIS